MARKKKEVPAQPQAFTIKDQIDWIRVRKDKNLFVAEPAYTTILELFTMVDSVSITIGSDDGSIVTCAGAFKAFLSEDNPALFTNLSQQVASAK